MRLSRALPFLEWFRGGYKAAALRADFVSGLTVALVLIPQSMAYAQLAGLPAYYGLYAAFLPPMVAALFGSSRQLATGPVAVVSLMTAATLAPLARAGSAEYVAYAVLLALIVGLFQLSLGLLKLGALVNFLSHPVVIGFTNAAAIIIATSQLSKIFGVSVDSAEHHYETVWRVVVAATHYVHWPTFGLGALAFAIMIGLKRLSPRLPYVLAAVVVTTLISWAAGFEHNEQVALDAIEPARVRALVERYNEVTRELASLSEARVLIERDARAEEGRDEALCARCHEARTVTVAMLEEGRPGPGGGGQGSPETSLRLHAMAGLLESRVTELREEAGELRAEIRDVQLVCVTGPAGPRRFHARGEAPEGAETDGRTWRIRIRAEAVDPAEVRLVGGGAVVGAVPSGLPSLALPPWDSAVALDLFVSAIIISILGFMEAISIAKAMAARTGQRLDPNQELIGQGLANVLGSFGQSYAVSGSFSRSAVNIQAGAVTGLSSVFTSAIVAVVLLLLTPLLYYLPQSVLAAVIMMAVVGLINVKGVAHAFHVQRSDGVISVVSFLATLAFAPHLDRGILVGVALSLGVFLYRKMKPAIAELSLARDGHLASAERLGLARCRHIAVIRFEGPLFFANVSYLEDAILQRTRSMPELKRVVFVANGINEIDASGEEALSLLVGRLRSGGYDVCFSGLSERIVDVLHRSHLYERIGEDHIFPSAAQAIDAVWQVAHQDSTEASCPLRKVVPLAGAAEAYRVKVLLVDDEEDFVEFAAKRLAARGLEVQTRHDGESALALLATRRFDVVVLDVAMPGMSGMEVLAEVRERWPEQPVVLLTGHASIEGAVEGIRGGALEYLQKPIELEKLRETIERIYGAHA